MTAVTSRLLRRGRTSVWTADERFVAIDEPDIWGHVLRDGWHVYWEVAAGRTGARRVWGWTRTRWGAWRKASAAAHKPGLTKAVTR